MLLECSWDVESAYIGRIMKRSNRLVKIGDTASYLEVTKMEPKTVWELKFCRII